MFSQIQHQSPRHGHDLMKEVICEPTANEAQINAEIQELILSEDSSGDVHFPKTVKLNQQGFNQQDGVLQLKGGFIYLNADEGELPLTPKCLPSTLFMLMKEGEQFIDIDGQTSQIVGVFDLVTILKGVNPGLKPGLFLDAAMYKLSKASLKKAHYIGQRTQLEYILGYYDSLQKKYMSLTDNLLINKEFAYCIQLQIS